MIPTRRDVKKTVLDAQRFKVVSRKMLKGSELTRPTLSAFATNPHFKNQIHFCISGQFFNLLSWVASQLQSQHATAGAVLSGHFLCLINSL